MIGIDEVGRGSLAGPVVVCAVALPRELRIKNYELGTLKDSKQLTVRQRERWSRYFKAYPRVRYALARVNPRGIERMNISAAANLAAQRACERLCRDQRITFSKCTILIDGGLHLGKARNLPNVKTIVKGDEKITAIKVASIIAKVFRDTFMRKMGKRYPRYGFEVHKGYGTKRHYAALKKYGPSKMHRRGWI